MMNQPCSDACWWWNGTSLPQRAAGKLLLLLVQQHKAACGLIFCFRVFCNADIPRGPKVAGWKTHPSFWPTSWTDMCTCLALSMWVATLISTEQSTCSSLCTFGSRGEKDTWFFGRLFYIPLVEIPSKRELCSRMALNYVAIFISITCGLAETCYELSGILHPRRVETTGLAADCLCLVGWFSYRFPPHPVLFLIPISDTLAAEKSYSCSRNVIFTQNNFYLAWLLPSAIKW